jgi:hypothetical protein
MLLRDFEKTENELEEKLVKRKEENADMQAKLVEIQAKIDAKRKDIDKFDDKQKQLLDTFHQMTIEETKFSDFLTKLYKKKIKRKKNVEGEEGEDGKCTYIVKFLLSVGASENEAMLFFHQ